MLAHERARLFHAYIDVAALDVAFPDRLANPGNEETLYHARGISAGGLASLTGYIDYATLDRIHDAWLVFIMKSTTVYPVWPNAWNAFEARACNA